MAFSGYVSGSGCHRIARGLVCNQVLLYVVRAFLGVVVNCRVEGLTMKMPAQYADFKKEWDAIEVSFDSRMNGCVFICVQ